ncbi:acyltransferase family protein [Rothia aerolata]|uniref:Acyltransferase n=1 Tax=Rothia aerolata TaxID=1812262 RepID=A0A917MS72_9MICC|nr:acyltransferase family protein [Rothia aerolata]GGH60263.1 acyltransferase [Rothia aerolata]
MVNSPSHPPQLLDSRFLETRGFRPEIQGLRALALFLVVTYHIWFSRVSGGVDVFLFISAFLLSLSSMRKINEGKPLALVKYWLHVFQRLLPAAATVVAGTVIASFIFLPASRLMSIVQDALATLLYFLNWRLAFNSVDYYAQDAAGKTPLQHFWSLSLQGQIFILWPLFFVLVALMARRLRFNLIGSAILVFGTIFALSLAFSVYETSHNQSVAYFDTRTRLWEFAAGTLLALLTFKWRPPNWARVPMGWIGIVGLVSCGFVLPVEQAFPGYLALWPLLSAALIILAGMTGSPAGADRILASKPLLKLGEISYALYLVHWPVFIIYSTVTGQNHPGFITGTLMILVCMVIAWAIHTYIEEPLRKDARARTSTAGGQALPWARPKRSFVFLKPIAVISACLLIVGGPLLASRYYLQQREVEFAEIENQAGGAHFPGALAPENEDEDYDYPPLPATDIQSQYDGLEAGSCVGQVELVNPVLEAECGFQGSGVEDSPTIAVIGGSHTGQSIAFYRELASYNQMNLLDLHTGGCRFPLEAEPNPTAECIDRNEAWSQQVLEQKPDYVALMLTQTSSQGDREILVPGVEEKIEQFTQAGIRVIGLRDNPRWKQNVYECAQTSKNDPNSCNEPVGNRLEPVNPAQDLIDSNSNLFGLDFTDQYCPEGQCKAVIGNVYVYMDNNHVSKAFGRTLSDFAQTQLDDQGWLSPTV